VSPELAEKQVMVMIGGREQVESMNAFAGLEPSVAERCKVECVCPELVAPIVGHVTEDQDAERVSRLFSVLADPTRIRILHALSLSDELCVCDIAFLIDLSQSAVSHQLRTLRLADVVSRRKEGRTMFYSLSDEHIRGMLNNGLEHLVQHNS